MNVFLFTILLLLFFIFELVYFNLADKYNIIDHPNHRSSHTKVTIRGGGIIFPVGFLLASFYFRFDYPFFLVGLLLISGVSFMDDINPVGRRIRIAIHLVAVALLFFQLGLFSLQWCWILLGLTFVIGTINAVNFMDGINGITGGYALITLSTLYYINARGILFTNENYLSVTICATLIFNFFNFRKQARCFAGDIGSVSIAIIIAFFLLQLILKTHNLNYVLLLLIYGLDSSSTVLFRVIRRENVFDAHRSHFYQFLSNEKKIPHLIVAFGYALVQSIINALLINFPNQSPFKLLLLIFLSGIIFILIRFKIEGFSYLTQNRKIINT